MVKKLVLIIFILFIGLIGYLLKSSFTGRYVESDIQNITDTIAPKPTTITSAGIPNRHLINTTFVPQAPEKNWDQPWQDACEEAALLTVHYYYQNSSPNIVNDLNSMFEIEKTLNFSHDVNQNQMSQVANSLWGYTSEILSNPNVDQIKQYLSRDIPVIITANGKTLYAENKHFKSGGPWYHAVVILGYNDDRRQFIVHDVGTQFGAYFQYSYDLLIESIHDFPTSGKKEDIDSGIKSALILVK